MGEKNMLFLPSVAHAFWSLLDMWHTFQSPFWLQARPERVPQRTKRVATAQWPENGCSVPVWVCPSAVECSQLPAHSPWGVLHLVLIPWSQPRLFEDVVGLMKVIHTQLMQPWQRLQDCQLQQKHRTCQVASNFCCSWFSHSRCRTSCYSNRWMCSSSKHRHPRHTTIQKTCSALSILRSNLFWRSGPLTIAMLCNSMSHKPICSRSIKTLQCLVNFTSSSNMKAPEVGSGLRLSKPTPRSWLQLRLCLKKVRGTCTELTLQVRSTLRQHSERWDAGMLRNARALCLLTSDSAQLLFEDKVHSTKQLILLEDRFRCWQQKHGNLVSAQAKTRLQEQLKVFAELVFRTEHPKAMSKQEKDKESKRKRKDELTKAEAEFRIMDVNNKLLAMAVLEFATLSGKSGTQKSQHVVPTTGALAYFVKQHPDLAKKYNISVGSTVSKPKSKPMGSNDKDRGRSGSRTSIKSRQSSLGSHRSRQSAKSAKSSRASRASSRNKSKGKGKGKGKGKQTRGKGQSKGTGHKQVRMKTPAPHNRSWLSHRPRRRSFWKDNWSIDFDMYLKFRLRKMSLVQLERPFCMPVHILTSPDFEIPTYVLVYLSKGGKFVADRCASSAAKVLTSGSALERSLNTAVFFDRHALEPTFSDVAVSELLGSPKRIQSFLHMAGCCEKNSIAILLENLSKMRISLTKLLGNGCGNTDVKSAVMQLCPSTGLGKSAWDCWRKPRTKSPAQTSWILLPIWNSCWIFFAAISACGFHIHQTSSVHPQGFRFQQCWQFSTQSEVAQVPSVLLCSRLMCGIYTPALTNGISSVS